MRNVYAVLTSAALALTFAAALHAQTPTSKESNRAIPGTVTMTGCVERADEVAGSGAAAATVDSLSFVLIRSEIGSAKDQPTGTSGTVPPISKNNTYRLSSDTVKLNPHVGHKVEVTGSLNPPAMMTSDAVNQSPAANAPTLKVTNIKMVSATCDR